MAFFMGIVKDKNGVFYARRKVPKGMEERAAIAAGVNRPKLSWLKRSLGTKDRREAAVLAKPVLIKFDAILSQARSPEVSSERGDLTPTEIEEIAAHHYAAVLGEDEESRVHGLGSEALFLDIQRQLTEAGTQFHTPFRSVGVPEFGMSEREYKKTVETTDAVRALAKRALARGDLSLIEEELEDLMQVFDLKLDRESPAFRKLGYAVLKAQTLALDAIHERNQGAVIETPQVTEPEPRAVEAAPLKATRETLLRGSGATLDAAFEGWTKAQARKETTLREFTHAIKLFKELFGEIALTGITRAHVREFREALQAVPARRSGGLLRATLPELVRWSATHPDAKRIAPATVNKILTVMQALTSWAYQNGVIPDGAAWANPFSRMHIEAREAEREPWTTDDLGRLFASPVFADGARPRGGGGDAAYWLPHLGLYTGARLGELVPLTVQDIETDHATGIVSLRFREDEEQGRHLKTVSSRRLVPMHPKLKSLGFSDFVAERRETDGDHARLFVLLKRGPKGGYGENWSKWFGSVVTFVQMASPIRPASSTLFVMALRMRCAARGSARSFMMRSPVTLALVALVGVMAPRRW
jgi:integrase